MMNAVMQPASDSTAGPNATNAQGGLQKEAQEEAHIVVVPGSPALVEGLGRGDAASQRLRDSSVAALRAALALRPATVRVVCDLHPATMTRLEGSFAAWGAPEVQVGGGYALGELLARYLMGLAAAALGCSVEIDEITDQIGELTPQSLIVVVADGSAGMHAKAPLAAVDGADEAHRWIVGLLSGTAGPGDDPAVAGRDGASLGKSLAARGVGVPALWEQLAAILGQQWGTGTGDRRPSGSWQVREQVLLDQDSTLGVGRYVAKVAMHR